MALSENDGVTRRGFLKTASATAAILSAPGIVTAQKTAASETIIGEGDFKYRVDHNWAKLPEKFAWQTTHNVAVDKAQNVYVIHEGRSDQTDHPSIFVFDSNGKYIRSFGSQFQGGGHGIEVRQEGSDEFLYVCAYQNVKSFAKMDLTGNVIWQRYAPMQSGVYHEGEAANPKKVWGRDRFMPTNFAFLDDGGFLLVDGYGAFYIHQYDKHGNYQRSMGGPGKGEGTFATPHGIWIDRRPGREQSIVICDRAHHTLQYLTMNGEHIETLTGYGLPANIDTLGDLMLVSELHARITIHGKDNKVVARLGDDVKRITSDGKKTIRNDESKWLDGKFVHPHDACFDAAGNIYVAEWVNTGRVTKLTKVS